MYLIMSDKSINVMDKVGEEYKYIDLSKLDISNCMGCFNCWLKTPGKCAIRDDATKVYPLIGKSNKIMYISKIKYGGYDTIMKTMVERSIPIQQPFITIVNGETHHIQRDVPEKDAVIIAYGNPSEKEKLLFKRFINRNVNNTRVKSHKIIFVDEKNLDKVVSEEIESWER